jgi:hypothetical protein
MFRKHLRLRKFFGGIVVLAAIPVVAVPSALAMTSTGGGGVTAPDAVSRYLLNNSGPAQHVQGYRFITDTLGGTRHLVQATQPQVQPNRFTSDTFAPAPAVATVHGYNSSAYVHGGATPAVAKAIQDSGSGRTAAPVVADVSAVSNGGGSNWKDFAIVGLGALLLVALLGGFRPRRNKGTVSTA